MGTITCYSVTPPRSSGSLAEIEDASAAKTASVAAMDLGDMDVVPGGMESGGFSVHETASGVRE